MQANWKPIKTDTPGVTRYQKGHSKAEITRQENGWTEATLKEGFLGLGTHVHASMRDAGDDKAVLSSLEETAHPPRFSNWKEVKSDDKDVARYEGETVKGGKVKAEITRNGDEADVVAKAGFFGVQCEGHYFAPAPSDREILKRISSNRD